MQQLLDKMVEYKHKEKFESLLCKYQQTPRSKKLTRSLIKFESMYRGPRGYFRVYNSFFGDPLGLAREAQIKRTQVYNTKKGLIKTIKGRHGKSLVLTSKGRKVFFKEYPLAKLRQRPWDGNWTLVSYDIPSNKKSHYVRDKLRRNLREFGFGRLHQSLMVSPLPLEEPIREFIVGERLEDHVVVLTSKRILGLKNREIAKIAYNLDELGLLYNDLNQNFANAQKEKTSLRQWRAYFLATDNSDPQLPKELLPKDWPGFRCREKFESSFNLIEKLFDR
jgi:DNA-binding transcriptional regulator PaaX